jgi:hypothetical protein
MLANNSDNADVGARTLGDQLRRRRLAAARSEPMRCGHRDPLHCLARHPKHPRRDLLTDREVDGWAHAAAHLLTLGLPPTLGRDTLRALWRHGHHRLAQQCYYLAGGDT